MDKTSKIYVAGHNGMLGSAIVRRLRAEGHDSVMTVPRAQLDLTSQRSVRQFFDRQRPEYVFLAAARVGGIAANDERRADFIYQNTMIAANVISAAHDFGASKLLFLGSSCVYPRDCPQPIREEYLLTGPLEQTNEPYAVAKIAGIKMAQSYMRQHGSRFVSCMPTNLYGPGDNYDLRGSHVLPALLRKAHEAAESGGTLTVWGDGTPRREFMHVDDAAAACTLIMREYEDESPINVGTGTDVSISELVGIVSKVTGYSGQVEYDRSMPNGTPRKLLDVSKLTSMGFRPTHELEDGIRSAYADYLSRR